MYQFWSMEIVGVVKSVTDTCVTLETVSKKQNIDIFFPENKIEAVQIRFEPHMVTALEVDVQSVDIGHVNLAKFWLKYVIFPWLPKDDDDLSLRQRERREKILVLYRKHKEQINVNL